MSEWERWNTHWSTEVEVDVMNFKFRLKQDPNSNHLGTTVWDSSIVLAKYLEKCALSNNGDVNLRKLRGKNVVELGSGMGLGGLVCALRGANVQLTDQKEVLPLLQANVERNFAPGVLKALEWEAANIGQVQVYELDWENVEQQPKLCWDQIDLILCADCVYKEELVEHLLSTVLNLCGSKTTVVVVNEDRSDVVNERFDQLFRKYFTIKKVPQSKMDSYYRHPKIDILILKKKKGLEVRYDSQQKSDLTQ
eukprot:TRINITY_DN102066_c0_g1_i2.p1 TRINITY_DN102066_c0_g1~~TRINITY_DN102066_c0_g1_i2.p1  ORF type:complete len:251 (-),score=31.76 TRINITY_DN102066_c0_g1_i2:121-873(-)